MLQAEYSIVEHPLPAQLPTDSTAGCSSEELDRRAAKHYDSLGAR